MWARSMPRAWSAPCRRRRADIENLVKTGDPAGGAPPLATGWSKVGATLTITDTTSFSMGTTELPVIRISAEVPFDPLLRFPWPRQLQDQADP
ncbi:MAG: hypothetical protein U1E97_11015 [Alphaproteobacteria bacterium]